MSSSSFRLPNPLLNFEDQRAFNQHRNLKFGLGLLAASTILYPVKRLLDRMINGPTSTKVAKFENALPSSTSNIQPDEKLGFGVKTHYMPYFFPGRKKRWTKTKNYWKKGKYQWKSKKWSNGQKREKGRRNSRNKKKRFNFVYKKNF